MNVIAVDVGTTSVRLAIIRFQGDQSRDVTVIASHELDIEHKQDGLKFEQSSRLIWDSICECSKICLSKSKTPPNSIKGIAFSATCSLVIQTSEQAKENDIIMWMDHRAVPEAQAITSSKSAVLQQFGGICSPEFSLSKLAWLEAHEPERLRSAKCLLELPDWLAYRCLGLDIKQFRPSLCCVVCKWGFNAELKCHCDIVSSMGTKYNHITGNGRPLCPGSVAGTMSPGAARELGLLVGDKTDSNSNKENHQDYTDITVATSLIDAHSGMLAMLSVPLLDYGLDLKLESTFCSLAGTSSCHMLLSSKPNYTRGIWGPYKDVVLQGYYLLEAGQSLTGKLIEILIESHEEGRALIKAGHSVKQIIRRLSDEASSGNRTNEDISLHILPTFHGNRSPLANARLRGGIYGLSSEGPPSLLEQYISTVESIVYETKFIVETLGIQLDAILVSGGLMKNDLFMQTLADVLSCKAVKLSIENVDLMVLGSSLLARQAILNAAALGEGGKLNEELGLTKESITSMRFEQLDIGIYKPRKVNRPYHEKKYSCYKEFVEFSERLDRILHPND